MPNWTFNTIIMDDICLDKELFTELEDKSVSFDFEKLVPSPKTEEEYLASGGAKYINPSDDHVEQEVERPWFNWYRWNCDQWGTKWNSSDTTLDGDDTVSFNTAWCAPFPIFEALSKKFPDKRIEIYSDYEDGLYCRFIYQQGKMLVSTECDYNDWDDEKEDWRDSHPDDLYAAEYKYLDMVKDHLLQLMTDTADPERYFYLESEVLDCGQIKSTANIYRGHGMKGCGVNIDDYYTALNEGRMSRDEILSRIDEAWNAAGRL